MQIFSNNAGTHQYTIIGFFKILYPFETECTPYSNGRDIATLPAEFKPANLQANQFVAAPKRITVLLKVDATNNMHMEIKWAMPPEGKYILIILVYLYRPIHKHSIYLNILDKIIDRKVRELDT